MNFSTSIKEKLYNKSNNFSKSFYIFIAVLYILSICSMLYYDICDSTYLGISLFNGDFRSVISDGYPLPIYFIFAIWNFPTWIFTKITGTEIALYTSSLAWVWAKCLPCFFVILDSFLMIKLGETLKLSKQKSVCASIIFLTSFSTVVPALVIGQYECIPLAFILSGLIFYLKNDDKKFFLFFAIAIVLKYFAIIIFIPLILLKEKNVLKIIGKTCIGLSVSLFFILLKTLLIKSNSYTDSTVINSIEPGLATHIFEYFTGNTIVGSSAFIVLYTILCIYLWFHDFSEYDFNKLTIYVCLLSYLVLFLCARGGFYYWLILTIPFISFIIVTSSIPLKLLFLTTLGQLAAVFGTVINISWFFTPNNISQLGILPRIWVNETPVRDLAHCFGMLHIDTFLRFGMDIYVAVMIYFLIAVRPNSKIMKENGSEIELPLYIWIFRLLMLFGFVAMIYLLYFI